MKFVLVFFFLSVVNGVSAQSKTDSTHIRFAFGSCIKHTADLSIFDTIWRWQPDYTLLLGDIGYIDSPSQDTACTIYDSIFSNSSFKRLNSFSTIYGTWDDHDFGQNDGGKYFSAKEASKERFLDFYSIPANSKIRKHAGIYSSYSICSAGKIVQLIFLDTRTFRSNLFVNEAQLNPTFLPYLPDYLPINSSDSTLLGPEQWIWLKAALQQPADVRILCSSIQFAHSFNGYESWNNFPKEKKQLIHLIAETKAEGLVVLSGDVHLAEFSVQNSVGNYPIYDFTSSGLSSKWGIEIPNENRISDVVYENHFGLLDIDWNKEQIAVYIVDKKNSLRLFHLISLKELQFK